jgi:GTP-binding protein
VLALNKWDVTRTDLDDARARAKRKLRLRPPVMTCSALTGRGVAAVLLEAISLAHKAAERIPTPQLNKLLASIVADRPPPQRHGRRLRLYYAAQVGRRPPRFAIQVNDRKLINRDWAFYLENRLREAYGLQGVPLVIDYVPRKRYARARARATR